MKFSTPHTLVLSALLGLLSACAHHEAKPVSAANSSPLSPAPVQSEVQAGRPAHTPQSAPISSTAPAPLAVVDETGEKAGLDLPRNYRAMRDLDDADRLAIEVRGLAELNASGSAQSSATGLRAIAKASGKPTTIVDLRQENHLLVNGEPVSWYGERNWANLGKATAEVCAAEEKLQTSITTGGPLALCSSDDIKGGRPPAPVRTIATPQARTESQEAASLGLGYVRLAVTDHCRPSDAVVDDFIRFERSLPAGTWLHFHCRAGRGRTTTFLALHDMLRNAATLPLEVIVARQERLAGGYDLLARKADATWKGDAARERAAFIRNFYRYAAANPGGQPQLWSEWLAANAQR